MNSTLDYPKVSVRKHVMWLPVERQGTVNPASLSVELENFAEYVRLDDIEVVARRSLLIDLHESLQADNRFESSRVYQYGSFPAGLSTFMSDVDVSVNHLFELANDGNISRFMESNSTRKRPASSVDDTFCDLKRARTGANGINSPLSEVAALRLRVAEKLASKNGASEVLVEDDAPVSWTIETTRTASWLDERDMENESPEDFISSDDHNSSEEGKISLRQFGSSFAPARIRRKDKLSMLQKLHYSLQVPSLHSLFSTLQLNFYLSLTVGRVDRTNSISKTRSCADPALDTQEWRRVRCKSGHVATSHFPCGALAIAAMRPRAGQAQCLSEDLLKPTRPGRTVHWWLGFVQIVRTFGGAYCPTASGHRVRAVVAGIFEVLRRQPQLGLFYSD